MCNISKIQITAPLQYLFSVWYVAERGDEIALTTSGKKVRPPLNLLSIPPKLNRKKVYPPHIEHFILLWLYTYICIYDKYLYRFDSNISIKKHFLEKYSRVMTQSHPTKSTKKKYTFLPVQNKTEMRTFRFSTFPFPVAPSHFENISMTSPLNDNTPIKVLPGEHLLIPNPEQD